MIYKQNFLPVLMTTFSVVLEVSAPKRRMLPQGGTTIIPLN
jgi:hypothetical protein